MKFILTQSFFHFQTCSNTVVAVINNDAVASLPTDAVLDTTSKTRKHTIKSNCRDRNVEGVVVFRCYTWMCKAIINFSVASLLIAAYFTKFYAGKSAQGCPASHVFAAIVLHSILSKIQSELELRAAGRDKKSSDDLKGGTSIIPAYVDDVNAVFHPDDGKYFLQRFDKLATPLGGILNLSLIHI